MSGLPFTISAEADMHLRENLREAKKHTEISGLLPILYYAFNSRSTSIEGRTLEWCRIGFFAIGWYRPEQVTEHYLDEIELGNEKIYVLADTVERLASKTLVLETVEVGYPDPADKKVRLLRAI